MKITSNQLRAVQAILGKITSDRDDRISLLSDMFERPITSTKDLTFDEAKLILERFGGDELKAITVRKQQLKATIYHLSMKIEFLNLSYPGDDYDNRRMNMAKVDMWLLTHGIVKKRVKEMSIAELGKVIGQMKAILSNL
ncbi:MAG: hypothetical protein MJZ87_00475 [Bacteroidales bacterium]|nr:hypothetical protein [Bacteroidales bacterium]